MNRKRTLLELRHVYKRYAMDGVTVNALDDVSLQVFRGDLLAIAGASGSGKSTLLHLLGLLDKPSKGEVIFLGKKVSRLDDDQLAALRNRAIGFVFQQFNLLPRTTVLENVLLPVWYNPAMDWQEARRKAKALLKKVGMGKRMFHFPNQLSGGEQQRTAIVRALICDPQLILADEPTGNLDSKTGKEIIDLLLELNKKEGRTMIIVTHDINIAKLGKQKIFLGDGKIIREEK